MKWIIAFLAALVALSAQVHAHGIATWIMQGPYVDRAGIHCCGPTDCDIAKPGELEHVNGGWLHIPTGTRIEDGEQGIYPSIDVQLWRCVRGGQLKCVFPATGF